MPAIKLIEDQDFNALVLDKGDSPSPISKLKQGPVASIYIGIMLKEFTNTFKFISFPIIGALTLVGTVHSFAKNILNRKNKNAHFLFNMGVMTLFGLAEIAALLIAMITVPAALLIATPIIYTVMSGYALLRSIAELFYHGFRALYLWSQHETFSVEFNETLLEFKKATIGFFINSIMFLGSLTTFLAPYVPAIGAFFGMTATLVIQIASASVLSVGFLGTLDQGIKSLFGKSLSEKLKEGIQLFIKKFKGKEEDLHPKKMKVNDVYLQENRFSSLNSHLGDLQIKLQVLNDQDQEENKGRGYNMIKNLLNEEKNQLKHLGNNHVKNRMLNALEEAIQNPAQDSIKNIVKKYDLKKTTTSYFKEVGGMQKLLVLSNQYCGFFKKPSSSDGESAHCARGILNP